MQDDKHCKGCVHLLPMDNTQGYTTTFPKYFNCGGAIKQEYKIKIFSAILLCSCRVYGINGGGIGGCGIEGGADRVVRNGNKDGLAASVAFRSMTCPFLYTVKVMLSPAILC